MKRLAHYFTLATFVLSSSPSFGESTDLITCGPVGEAPKVGIVNPGGFQGALGGTELRSIPDGQDFAFTTTSCFVEIMDSTGIATAQSRGVTISWEGNELLISIPNSTLKDGKNSPSYSFSGIFRDTKRAEDPWSCIAQKNFPEIMVKASAPCKGQTAVKLLDLADTSNRKLPTASGR